MTATFERITGTAWGEVRLEDIARFLEEMPEDEGIDWECKGTTWPNADSICKAACALANRFGGHLIIGAVWNRANSEWSLTGVQAPADAIHRLGQWLSSRLRPAPNFDAKGPFDSGDGRSVFVVRVEPVAAPPCMTQAGLVYQRVPGASALINDPRLMAELVEAGDAARRATEGRAARAATYGGQLGETLTARPAAWSVGAATLGRNEDRNRRLFTAGFGEKMWELFGSLRVAGGHPSGLDTARSIGQSHLAFSSAVERLPIGYCACAFWNCSAAGSIVSSTEAHPSEAFEGLPNLKHLWNVCASLISELGGYGPVSLHLAIFCSNVATARPDSRQRDVTRWFEDPAELTDAGWASIRRETERAIGLPTLEPDDT